MSFRAPESLPLPEPSNPVTHRRVLNLAVPIILANLTVPLVGAVDTAVVGHLAEPHHMGAIAIGALIFSFLYWGFGFLRMGTTGFVARAAGLNDHEECQRILARGLLLAGVLAILILALQWPIMQWSLTLIDSTPRVESLTETYFFLRIWSAPATLIIYVTSGMLIGLGRTRGILVLQLVLNLVNVALDLLFVPVLGYGVGGVAVATVIAEYLAAITGLLLIYRYINLSRIAEAWCKNRAAFRTFIISNTNIFVRTLCLIFSFSWFTIQGAALGELVLAANAILMHLMTTMAYGLDGFAHAAEALTGNAYASRQSKVFKQTVRLTTLWAGLTAMATTLIYLVWGGVIISWFTDIPEVTQTALWYLPWVIATPLLSVWSYQLDGIFIGSGQSRQMRDAMVISTLGYLALVWLLVPIWGNHGLWLSLVIFMVLRALTLLVFLPGVTRQLGTD